MSPTPSAIDNNFLDTVLLGALTNPPTAFPKITVGGEEFELRYTFRSQFFLEQSDQIPGDDLAAWLSSQYYKKHTSSMLMIMTGAMLGHEVNGKWKATPITGIDFADRILRDEWVKVSAAYADSLGKVWEAIKTALTPPPAPKTTEPEATPQAIN